MTEHAATHVISENFLAYTITLSFFPSLINFHCTHMQSSILGRLRAIVMQSFSALFLHRFLLHALQLTTTSVHLKFNFYVLLVCAQSLQSCLTLYNPMDHR